MLVETVLSMLTCVPTFKKVITACGRIFRRGLAFTGAFNVLASGCLSAQRVAFVPSHC